MSVPNILTLVRILLCPFFFTALIAYDSGDEKYRLWAVFFFVSAALTDMLDGFLARRLQQTSALGQFLDPLADKLLLLSGFLGILFVKPLLYHPPLWITVTIVFRDLVIGVGLLVVFLVSGKIQAKSDLLGKWTSAFQMMTLAAILLQWSLAVPLWQVSAVLSVLSCLSYVFRGLQFLKDNGRF